MFGRVLVIGVLLGVGYWYFTGPYQAQHNPDEAQRLRQDIEKMRECIRGQNYQQGATGVAQGDPEAACAERYHLHWYEGEWRRSAD